MTHAFGASIPDSFWPRLFAVLGLAGLGLFRRLGRSQSRPPAPWPYDRSSLASARLECHGGLGCGRPDSRSAARWFHGGRAGAYRSSSRPGSRGAASLRDHIGDPHLDARRVCPVDFAAGHRHPHRRAWRHVVGPRRPVLRRRRAVADHLPGQRGPVSAWRWRPHRCPLDLSGLVADHSWRHPGTPCGPDDGSAVPDLFAPNCIYRSGRDIARRSHTPFHERFVQEQRVRQSRFGQCRFGSVRELLEPEASRPASQRPSGTRSVPHHQTESTVPRGSVPSRLPLTLHHSGGAPADHGERPNAAAKVRPSVPHPPGSDIGPLAMGAGLFGLAAIGLVTALDRRRRRQLGRRSFGGRISRPEPKSPLADLELQLRHYARAGQVFWLCHLPELLGHAAEVAAVAPPEVVGVELIHDGLEVLVTGDSGEPLAPFTRRADRPDVWHLSFATDPGVVDEATASSPVPLALATVSHGAVRCSAGQCEPLPVHSPHRLCRTGGGPSGRHGHRAGRHDRTRGDRSHRRWLRLRRDRSPRRGDRR